MYMILLFTFSHQMPGKQHIIVGTEPIHFDAFNTALNTEIKRRGYYAILLSDNCER